MPTVHHDDVREELFSELSDAGRRQYEALGAVYEARELTAQLAQLRLAANLSQRQAAKRAGVDQADVSRIESGQITPSLPTLLRLLDAVGATLVLARRPAPLKSAAPARSPVSTRTKAQDDERAGQRQHSAVPALAATKHLAPRRPRSPVS